MFFDDYDLDALHLVGVVGQTMDPAAVSLWLRQPTTTVLAAVGVRR